jgi:tRNA(Ile)-lysidine synthase
MLPDSGVPGSPAQRLLRPLLCLRRPETETVCAAAGIEPRLDATNSDVAVLRNRLRSETLPALEAVNPSARNALLGIAASAREAFAELERRSFMARTQARTPVGAVFARGDLAALPGEALILVVEREAAFFKLEPEVNRTRVENLRSVLARGTGRVAFGPVEVQASSGMVRIGPPIETHEFDTKVLNIPGTTLAGPFRVEVATNPLPPAEGSTLAVVDGAALTGALRVRPLQPADRMTFRGMTRKVADILANEKVPAWDRQAAIAIADGELVRAVLGPGGVLGARAEDDDALYVRISVAAPPPPADDDR